MKYRKILLAYDGSHEGKRALLETADLATFLQAETHLLAVATMPPSLFLTEGFVPEELLEEEKKRSQGVLDEGIRNLRERGFNATGHLAVGEPVEEICRLAKSVGADLVVVGHNQKTSFAARWWKGSVGATLLDHAPCSILIALSRSWCADSLSASFCSSPPQASSFPVARSRSRKPCLRKRCRRRKSPTLARASSCRKRRVS